MSEPADISLPAIPDYPRSHRRWLLVIVAFGILLRLVLAIAHPFLFDDSKDYIDLANALLHHQPYGITAHGFFLQYSRIPGYPLFLAFIFSFTGPNITAVAVVQAFLSAGIVHSTYCLARRISPTIGLVAAALIALDPLTIGFSAAILSEMPFTLAFLLFLRCALLLSESSDHGITLVSWTFLGILAAFSIYMRASVLYCLPILGILILLEKPTSPITVAMRVLGLYLACLVCFLLLLPWYHFTSGGWLPGRLTSLEGISLYEAVYPGADGGPKQDVIPLPAYMATMTEWQRDAEWNRLAWIEIKNNPARIAKLAFIKFARTWSPWLNGSDLRSPLVQSALILWQVPLFLLALIGLFAKMPWRVKSLLLIPLLYFSALHSLFLGSVRYRVPLMPLVCIFAAAGAVTCVNRFMAKRTAASGV